MPLASLTVTDAPFPENVEWKVGNLVCSFAGSSIIALQTFLLNCTPINASPFAMPLARSHGQCVHHPRGIGFELRMYPGNKFLVRARTEPSRGREFGCFRSCQEINILSAHRSSNPLWPGSQFSRTGCAETDGAAAKAAVHVVSLVVALLVANVVAAWSFIVAKSAAAFDALDYTERGRRVSNQPPDLVRRVGLSERFAGKTASSERLDDFAIIKQLN